MTPTTLPPITSQADLHETWTRLMGPFGFGRRSLWLLVIGADDRALPSVTEVSDVAAHPDSDAGPSWTRLLSELVGPDERVAFLISRPGRDGLTSADREWAATLYEACHRAGVASETVHRANDAGVLPVPLDDLDAPSTDRRPAITRDEDRKPG